jgi:hypothetical protein
MDPGGNKWPESVESKARTAMPGKTVKRRPYGFAVEWQRLSEISLAAVRRTQRIGARCVRLACGSKVFG